MEVEIFNMWTKESERGTDGRNTTQGEDGGKEKGSVKAHDSSRRKAFKNGSPACSIAGEKEHTI